MVLIIRHFINILEFFLLEVDPPALIYMGKDEKESKWNCGNCGNCGFKFFLIQRLN